MLKLLSVFLFATFLLTGCAKSFEQQEMDDMPKEFLEDEDYKADMQEHQREKMLNSMRCGGGR